MVFVITFVLFINSNVYAICDTADMNRLKEITKNVEVSYKHNVYGSIDDVNDMLVSVYEITVSGLTTDMYIVDDNGNTYYYEQTVDGVISYSTSFGERKVYIFSKKCYGSQLTTKTFILPRFNFKSVNEVCKKNEFIDLDICSEFLEKDEEIISNQKFKEEIKKEENKQKNFLYKSIDFLKENILFAICGIVLLAVLLISFI